MCFFLGSSLQIVTYPTISIVICVSTVIFFQLHVLWWDLGCNQFFLINVAYHNFFSKFVWDMNWGICVMVEFLVLSHPKKSKISEISSSLLFLCPPNPYPEVHTTPYTHYHTPRHKNSHTDQNTTHNDNTALHSTANDRHVQMQNVKNVSFFHTRWRLKVYHYVPAAGEPLIDQKPAIEYPGLIWPLTHSMSPPSVTELISVLCPNS